MMMAAAFGEESATGSNVLSPSNDGTTLSQDSSDAMVSSADAESLPAAERSQERSLPERQRENHSPQDKRYRQKPHFSAASGDGTPTVSWSDLNRATTGQGVATLSCPPGDGPLSPSEMSMAPQGFSMADGRGMASGYEPVPTVAADRRKWTLRATNPNHDRMIAPERNDDLVSPAPEADRAIDSGAWSLGMTPPRWVPDEETAACAGCGKDFDWARRRHHCRACGRLYCYSCSRFRALLPRSFGTRDPQRVCQPCNARVAPLQEMLVGSVSNAVKENDLSQGGLASYLNRPIVFTLGAEVRKAAYTIHNFTKEGMIQDRSIPQELLGRAKGLAFLTVIKGGFILAGRIGTGLVLAKTEDGMWSAPSAIATVGLGWGALIGGEITDFVLVLNTDSAVEAFSGRGQISIGAELSVAVGPLGRTGAGNVSVAAEGLAHAYSYSHSRGLFAGLSLEGGVIMARQDVNRKFYGRDVSVRELLSGSVAPPPAARPLYEALEQRGSRVDRQPLLSQGFRMG